jgi:hypothetical protein
MRRETVLNTAALEICAIVEVRPPEFLPIVRSLVAGWGPVVYFRGKYYPGRVLSCERPIESGTSGQAVIGVMATNAESAGFHFNRPLRARRW